MFSKLLFVLITLLFLPSVAFALYVVTTTKAFKKDFFLNFAYAAAICAGLALCLSLLLFVKALLVKPRNTKMIVLSVSGALASIFFVALDWFLGILGLVSNGLSGGAWGRPLRVQGKQTHPKLCIGTDWCEGEKPSALSLDKPTRAALEALWLHDAQKEHASVPAFSRVCWLLAAAGAPPDLLAWAHRAAIEEIEHTKACFALAAGYAGRSHSVKPMPELLHAGFGKVQDVLHTLVVESLTDGGQLEDFNADVALACARVCREAATQKVLARIAKEERSHAAFSWATIEWANARYPKQTRAALLEGLNALEKYPRPSAATLQNQRLIDAANANALKDHGRLPDEIWAEIWHTRLSETKTKAAQLLSAARAA